jgi:hypothetical protein
LTQALYDEDFSNGTVSSAEPAQRAAQACLKALRSPSLHAWKTNGIGRMFAARAHMVPSVPSFNIFLQSAEHLFLL